MKKRVLQVLTLLVLLYVMLTLNGCAWFDSQLNDIKGQLVGNSFECQFYDNSGGRFLTASGTKVGMVGNIIEEKAINSETGSSETVYSLSSVVTINIDGKQIQSCGDTIIFEETGLNREADFTLTDITSTSTGAFSENTYISNIVNHYKNAFGKSQVVVIQSQLGVPICAYSGEEVYWEIRDDLPKTTKLMIDGRALYIHRANFQIIDKALIQ